MIAALGQRVGLDRAGVGQALLLAFAAWAAFALASSLHIANAYWAAMPVWVVAQSSRGLLLERGFYRVVGTILGAGFGFAVLHLLGNPYLQLLATALWIAFNAALTHVLRGMATYGALLGGMTAAVVVLPSVLSPERSLEIALARVECTLIGVVVTTLVTGFFTPPPRRADFYARVRRMAGDAVDYVALLLRGGAGQQAGDLERRILVEMSEIPLAAAPVAAASIKGYRRIRHVDATVVAALSAMAAGRALQARGWTGIGGPDAIEELGRLAQGLRDGGAGPPQGRPAAPSLEGDARLSAALDDLAAAVAALQAGSRMDAVAEVRTEAGSGPLNPNRDWGLGLRVGILSGGVTWLAAAAAYAAAWPAGELAALGVCIFSLVLGSMPLPQAIAPHMLRGVTAGAFAALVYRFGLQPHIQTLPELLLSVAPFLLLGGFARASRVTAIPAIDYNMCFLLASQAVLPAVTDPAAILNEVSALMLGAVLTTTGFILMPRRPDRQAARAIEAIRRDVERLAAGPKGTGPARWDLGATRRILRLTLHVSRAGDARFPRPRGLLGVLNLGHAIIELQRSAADPGLGEADRAVVEDAISALGGFRSQAPDPEALERQAAALSDDRSAQALRDAAAALREAGRLLSGRPAKNVV